MSKKIKLKDLLNENFSGTMLGGVVSRTPFHTDQSLSNIVKEKYGDVDGASVDVKGLTTELAQYNKLGESIFGKSDITKISEKLSWIASQAKSHTLQETDSWFDKITVNRNMKEQRMGALYEDMGNILGRYYSIGETIDEESGGKEAYQKFFNAALKKYNVSSPDELEDDKKKDFFNYIDKNWQGDNEAD